MKIVFVQPTGDKCGHYGLYSSKVCQNLALHGNEVTLITNSLDVGMYVHEKCLFSLIQINDGKYDFTRFDHLRKTNFLAYAFRYLFNSFVILRFALKYAKQNKFDIIQITDAEFLIVSLLLFWYRRSVPNVVILLHAANFSYGEYDGNTFIKLYKSIQSYLFKRAVKYFIKGIVTLGEFHKDRLEKQLCLPKSFPIRVIYDGADPPSHCLSKKEARAKLELHYDGDLLFFFGMIRKDKGFDVLLKALSIVIRKHSVRLLVAGMPFDYTSDEIDELIRIYDLDSFVFRHLGYVPSDRLPYYFFSADAVVFPYNKIYSGGTGPLLKEAAMYKLPIIGTNVSIMGQLIQKHEMGYVVEPENEHALADAIIAFLDDSADRREFFGNNAFHAANSWKKMGKEYSDFYASLRTIH